MQRNSNHQKINEAIKQLDLNTEFDTSNLQFELITYQKGEQLVTPLSPLKHFVFLLSGMVRIYQIDENSTLHSLKHLGSGDVLGNNEFCFNNDSYTLYAEALTPISCLILPFSQPFTSLKTDSRFLLYLLRNTLLNHIHDSEMTHIRSDIEDKLIFYIENLCADHTLTCVNDAVEILHCSRRHLNRILSKLCDEQKIIHVKRGCYRLIK